MFGFLCNSFFLSEKTVSFVNSTDYLNNINNIYYEKYSLAKKYK